MLVHLESKSYNSGFMSKVRAVLALSQLACPALLQAAAGVCLCERLLARVWRLCTWMHTSVHFLRFCVHVLCDLQVTQA